MRRTWGHLAAGWAVLFAAVHLYWGFGGQTGLDVSAGPLAESRPAAFVALGLFGVVHAGDGVSSGQLTWSWLLWNPWFILGGVCFALASRLARTARPARAGTP